MFFPPRTRSLPFLFFLHPSWLFFTLWVKWMCSSDFVNLSNIDANFRGLCTPAKNYRGAPAPPPPPAPVVPSAHYSVRSMLWTKLNTKYTVQYWRPTVIYGCVQEKSTADPMVVRHKQEYRSSLRLSSRSFPQVNAKIQQQTKFCGDFLAARHETYRFTNLHIPVYRHVHPIALPCCACAHRVIGISYRYYSAPLVTKFMQLKRAHALKLGHLRMRIMYLYVPV